MCLRKGFRLRALFQNTMKPTRTPGTDLSWRKIHHILHIYVKQYAEYARKYARICETMHKYARLAKKRNGLKNMQNGKHMQEYAKICKIRNRDLHMQNMHNLKYALLRVTTFGILTSWISLDIGIT